MKLIKQIYVVFLFSVLVVGFLAIHNLTAADIDGFSRQPNSVSIDKETITEKQLVSENSGGGSLVFTAVEAKTTKTYLHETLGYSFEYPEDWLLATYPSNGYLAVGLYDPVAQEQIGKDKRALLQGVKIEISACDCAPATNNLKNTILEWGTFSPEKITEINEISLNVYQNGGIVSAVRTEFETKHGGGKGLYFTGRDGRFYTLTFGTPDFSTLGENQLREYELMFEELIQSFVFN